MIAIALLPLFLVTAQPTQPEAPQPSSPVQPVVLEDEPVDGWTGSISAGGIIRTGNNKTRNATATADALWRGGDNRVTLAALWSYADDNRIVNQRKLYGSGKYDHFLAEHTFAYAQTSTDYDKESGLDQRFTLGAGVGHQFVDDETWAFSAEAGLSGVSEDFQTSGKNEFLAARLAYNAKYNHSESWSFAQDVMAFPSLEDGDDIYVRAETRAQLTLTESMFVQFQWVMDYDNTPDTGKQRIDHLFAMTVGWGF